MQKKPPTDIFKLNVRNLTKSFSIFLSLYTSRSFLIFSSFLNYKSSLKPLSNVIKYEKKIKWEKTYNILRIMLGEKIVCLEKRASKFANHLVLRYFYFQVLENKCVVS